jgi:hypothetical protein
MPLSSEKRLFLRQVMAENGDKKTDTWKFGGFAFPTTTPVPDQIFDELLPRLSGAELKVLLYICRRTFGFKKRKDSVSLDQIANGIRTKSGKVLDNGTGLSRRHIQRVLKSLEEKNVVRIERSVTEDAVNEINTYSLNFIDEGVGTLSPHGRDKMSPGVETPESPRVGTPESPTTNSKQQTDSVVVIVDELVKRGITTKIAAELVKEYSAEHINDKIELLDYLLENDSPLVERNPAGYLLKAITDDYAPPKGFKTRSEREADALEEERQYEEQERQQQEWEEERKAEKQREQDRIDRIISTYQITPELLKAWGQVLDQIKADVPKATYDKWFEDTYLLSVEEGVATVGVMDTEVGEWLEARAGTMIGRMLRGILNREMIEEVKFEVMVFEP